MPFARLCSQSRLKIVLRKNFAKIQCDCLRRDDDGGGWPGRTMMVAVGGNIKFIGEIVKDRNALIKLVGRRRRRDSRARNDSREI